MTDSEIVIEVRGGCLVEVYCVNREQRFILLDWDNLNELPEDQRVGLRFSHPSAGKMPSDTRKAYMRCVSGYPA